jgi:hypothetical protein
MIEVDMRTKTASGLIPGQIIFLTLADGKCWRITRWGMDAKICMEEEKS